MAGARGGKSVTYGSIGSGSLGHLAMTLLAKAGQLDLVHVPYRGGGPLMNDALAGHVPLAIGSVFVTKPHIDSKRLRAAGGHHRQAQRQLPDVPTHRRERLRRLRRAGLVGRAGARPRRRPRSSSA